MCPECTSPYWDKPLGWKSRGRPKKTNIHHTSITPEWYTPDIIIDKVLKLYYRINLDPCTNSKVHPNIKADAYFDATDDGLKQPWFGSVYVNPPYGREVGKWVAKCIEEYTSGRVTEIVLLVPARVDTRWFAKIANYHWCSITGRLKFKSLSGNTDPAPFPSAVVYLGYRPEEFECVFESIGKIYKTVVNK
jgi:phage N-6-adenine-methyltransferase